MKYVVAVSGGVDSVVLLDMLVKIAKHELVVAHFDHGIRKSSDGDARFVRGIAEKYKLPFETLREELGESASEELARERRYAFLHGVADKHEARLITAHHQDDLLETIAINIERGTGWRGLAVFGNEAVKRPLLEMTKQEIYTYALKHQLEWVEDETNASDKYLRNRLRRSLHRGLKPNERAVLLQLWLKQQSSKEAISIEAERILQQGQEASRYVFICIEELSAVELLRTLLARQGASLTRPQRRRMLHAIKTMQPDSTFEAGGGVSVEFTKRKFFVKHS